MTESTVTYYDLLDIDPSADETTIRRAWRRAAKTDHPDLNNGATSTRFVACREAYETLIDPDKRRAYDAKLGQGYTTRSAQAGRSARGPQPPPSQSQSSQASSSKAIPYPRVRFSGSAGPAAVGYHPQILRREVLSFKPWRIIEVTRHSSRAVCVLATFATLISVGLLDGFVTIPWGWSLLTALALVAWAVMQMALAVAFFSAPGAAIMTFLPLIAAGLLAAMPGNTILPVAAAVVTAGACLLWAKVTRHLSTAGLDTVPPLAADTALFPIFGKPGQGLIGAFGKRGEIGALGERVTAAVLEQQLLPFMPGLRIYHGLRMSPDSEADVDHGLQYGNRVALIDTKVWADGTYRVSDYAGDPSILVTSPDGSESIREVHLPSAAQSYRHLLGEGVEVRTFVIVHPPNGSSSPRLINSENNEMFMGSAQSVVDEIANWMTDGAGDVALVDRSLMSAMVSMLK